MEYKRYDNCIEYGYSRHAKDNSLTVRKGSVLEVQSDITSSYEYFHISDEEKLTPIYQDPIERMKEKDSDSFAWVWALEDTEENREKMIDVLISYISNDIKRYERWIKECREEIQTLRMFK